MEKQEPSHVEPTRCIPTLSTKWQVTVFSFISFGCVVIETISKRGKDYLVNISVNQSYKVLPNFKELLCFPNEFLLRRDFSFIITTSQVDLLLVELISPAKQMFSQIKHLSHRLM